MLLTVKTNYSSNGYQGSIRKVFQRDNFEKKSCSRAQIWIIWNAAETAFFRTWHAFSRLHINYYNWLTECNRITESKSDWCSFRFEALWSRTSSGIRTGKVGRNYSFVVVQVFCFEWVDVIGADKCFKRLLWLMGKFWDLSVGWQP